MYMYVCIVIFSLLCLLCSSFTLTSNHITNNGANIYQVPVISILLKRKVRVIEEESKSRLLKITSQLISCRAGIQTQNCPTSKLKHIKYDDNLYTQIPQEPDSYYKQEEQVEQGCGSTGDGVSHLKEEMIIQSLTSWVVACFSSSSLSLFLKKLEMKILCENSQLLNFIRSFKAL